MNWAVMISLGTMFCGAMIFAAVIIVSRRLSLDYGLRHLSIILFWIAGSSVIFGIMAWITHLQARSVDQDNVGIDSLYIYLWLIVVGPSSICGFLLSRLFPVRED
jgi:hypothetical protein